MANRKRICDERIRNKTGEQPVNFHSGSGAGGSQPQSGIEFSNTPSTKLVQEYTADLSINQAIGSSFLPVKYRRRRRDLDLGGIERGNALDLIRRAVDAAYTGATETATALIACASKQIATGGAE